MLKSTIALVICTLIWRQVAPEGLRSKVIPWAFSLMILNICCAAFFSPMVHALLGVMNYGMYVVALDGFCFNLPNAHNRVWKATLFMFAYLILSANFGCYALDGMLAWLVILINSFGSGYFVCRWACRTEGAMRKLNFALVVISVLVCYYFIRHGGLNALEAGREARGGFDLDTLDRDMKTNVNYTALTLCTIMPFLLVGFLSTARSGGSKLLKIINAGTLLMCGLFLIRTGARNGGLGLFPMLWYFLFSTTNRMKRRKRIGLFVLVTLVFVIAVSFTMRGATELRAFNFTGKGQEFYDTKGDAMSSGRISMWTDQINQMNGVQKLLGRGLIKNDRTEQGRVKPGNAHSMYMAVFYNSGFVGAFLMLMMFCKFFSVAKRKADRGRMAMMLFGCWALTGVGEAWGMIGGATAFLAGFAIGLCTDDPVMNTELMSEEERYWFFASQGYRREVW